MILQQFMLDFMYVLVDVADIKVTTDQLKPTSE